MISAANSTVGVVSASTGAAAAGGCDAGGAEGCVGAAVAVAVASGDDC